MEDFRGSSRKMDRGPKEYMGSYNPAVSKNEQREIDGALGGASYVGIDVPDDYTTMLYHTGVGREYATEMMESKVRMAWYLKSAKKCCVIRKEYVSLMVGMKKGKVEMVALKGGGFIVLYTDLEMSGYFTPVILDDGAGSVAHSFVKVQLNEDVPESEMEDSRERKVVCILNELVELYMKGTNCCMICCKELTSAASSLFVNGGVCKMAACVGCCSEIGRGRKPWHVCEGGLNVLATVASSATAAEVGPEVLFKYDCSKAMYGQKKKIYQESVHISRDNVKIENKLAKKRSMAEEEIEELKKQCRANTRRIIDLQEQLDNFEEGYKSYLVKC
jgi:hypothetical protein